MASKFQFTTDEIIEMCAKQGINFDAYHRSTERVSLDAIKAVVDNAMIPFVAEKLRNFIKEKPQPPQR